MAANTAFRPGVATVPVSQVEISVSCRYALLVHIPFALILINYDSRELCSSQHRLNGMQVNVRCYENM